MWKQIQEYKGKYEISDEGEVRRISTGKILKQKVEKNGYVRVHLSVDGVAKSELIHRLVAKTFIPNPHKYKTVNHKDENKKNNRVCNLEWCDMSYQNRYGIGAKNRNKAKERPVLQYDKSGNFIARFDSIKKAATELGLNSTSIHCVCNGKRRYKSTGGYIFRYEG